MTCQEVREQDLVAKYLTRQLSGIEADAFESHYFGCEDCLHEVQVSQSIVASASPSPIAAAPVPAPVVPVKVTEIRPSRASRRWFYVAAAAAAGLVLTVIAVQKLSAPGKQGETALVVPAPTAASPANATVQPTVQPQPVPAEPRLLAANLAESAREVVPPQYRPSVLRGAEDAPAERFRRAMEAYPSHRYKKVIVDLASIPVAAPGDSAAPEEHITDAGIKLYLGISQLMLKQNKFAVQSLERAVAYGDTPYLESARFYLAKGLIRQQKYSAASEQLKQAVQLKGDLHEAATELLSQVEQLEAGK